MEYANGRLTEKDLKAIIAKDNTDYTIEEAYYKGKNPELYESWNARRQQGISPNNYAPSGYGGYIVDIMAGYIASPGTVEYASDDEEYIDVINKINKANSEPTTTNKQVRECCKHGLDYELHFISMDDKGQIIPRFVSVPGNECHAIYTDDIDPVLKAVVRKVRKDEKTYNVYVYYDDVMIKYIAKGDNIAEVETTPNLYKSIPWNIGKNNIDGEPDYLQVKTYINIIDSIQTNTLNSLDQNGRAVILTSMQKTPELAKNLKYMNAIFDMEKGDTQDGRDFWEYASMELNSDLREYMLDHFINELHKRSGVFDFTKLDLGTDPSGTALKYRIYPMELKASEKVAYRLEFLHRRYELITEIINEHTITGGYRLSGKDVDDLDITMKRNLPANIKAILDENEKMLPYTDTKTLLERIPGVDAEKVVERKAEEMPEPIISGQVE